MGKAASTVFPYTLTFGPLRYKGLVNGGVHLHKPCVSPSWTLHAYVYEHQPTNGLGKTLCGKRMYRGGRIIPGARAWLFSATLAKTECASCQRLQGRWYGTHG